MSEQPMIAGKKVARSVYRRPEWQQFRQVVIVRDGYMCQECNWHQADGAVLQVHHLQYLPGRRPWEYAADDCTTLCRGCHARVHCKVMPILGWELVEQRDLGDVDGACDRCDTPIRYECEVVHPQWSTMVVGSQCCDKLTGQLLAEQLQRADENRRDRQNRLQSRWHFVSGRNEWQATHKGLRLALVHTAGTWVIEVNGQRGNRRFDSLAEAKDTVFAQIDSGAIPDWARRVRA